MFFESVRLCRNTTIAALVLMGSAVAEDLSLDWKEAEKGKLDNHVQLTSEKQFRKAGECYFSPDGTQIIFQAIERLEDADAEEPFYQMYVADLVFEGASITGIADVKRLSPPGSSNTCGWFHPTEQGVVIFGSTVVPPSNPSKSGYQRKSSRYSWQFPQEMDIVRCELATADGSAASLERIVANPDAYLAECVISADGKFLVFCEHQISEGSSGGDLFIMDLADGRRVPATFDRGYDGGPFFSPDGKRICYRSDRRGDDLLQIFVAELAFDRAGNVLGVEREFQLTDNLHVNWAPYWHPDDKHLIYTTSEMGHENYEVFMIDADPGQNSSPTRYGTRRQRITHAEKFDGLPVFNAAGTLMMWTSQRGADGSSQVWLAEFVMPLDRKGQLEPAPAAKSDAKPERMQATDPITGLIFLYDTETHQLSIYNPTTHEHRPATTKEEMERGMELFRKKKESPGGTRGERRSG